MKMRDILGIALILGGGALVLSAAGAALASVMGRKFDDLVDLDYLEDDDDELDMNDLL